MKHFSEFHEDRVGSVTSGVPYDILFIALCESVKAYVEEAVKELSQDSSEDFKSFKFTGAEIQSGYNRIRSAEGLILRLPNSHDGRNTWLLNYGISPEASGLRDKRGILFDNTTQAAETIPD